MGSTTIKHPVPDRVKASFVIFNIRALWRTETETKLKRKNNNIKTKYVKKTENKKIMETEKNFKN